MTTSFQLNYVELIPETLEEVRSYVAKWGLEDLDRRIEYVLANPVEEGDPSFEWNKDLLAQKDDFDYSGKLRNLNASVTSYERNGRTYTSHNVMPTDSENPFEVLREPYVNCTVSIGLWQALTVNLRLFMGAVSVDVSVGSDWIPESEVADGVEAILQAHRVEPEPAAVALYEPAPVAYYEPVPTPFRVFIGHGGDDQWRIFRDELRDLHHFEIVAFEGTPRAGHPISDVLVRMADEATVALLVLTMAELVTSNDTSSPTVFRGRPNVVHEIGYFQGRLGWENAIIVAEHGVEIPSNLDGTQQIRFTRGNIRGAVGEAVAVLNSRR